MDDETRGEFSKVNAALTEIKTAVKGNSEYQRGLQLPTRMKEAEDEIKTKASWFGLYLAVGLVLAVVVAVMAIVSAVGAK